MSENNNQEFPKSRINWYPGHMAKTKRLIKENINLIDVVYELVDARIPFSSRVLELDEIVKDKIRLIIMTKSDLCDLEETNKWVSYYKELGYEVVLVNLDNPTSYKEVIKKTKEITKNIVGDRKEIRALVVGVPNVGKSTLINQMTKRKVAIVGNKPGVTTSLNWLKTNEGILLLDTPGILWPRLEQESVALNLAAMSAIKEEVVPIDEVAIHILKTLSNYYPDILKNRYGITKMSSDYEAVYDIITKYLHIPYTNGEVDYERISNIIYNDLKANKIKNITFDRKE